MTQLSDSMRGILRGIFLFDGLYEEERETLLSDLPLPEVFEKGENLYAGRPFRQMLGVVLDGDVQVSRIGSDGRRLVMNHLEQGALFGAAVLYGDCTEYVTEIHAIQRCTVLFLSQEWVSTCMKQDFRVAENYIRFLSGRIRFLNGKIAEYTAGQADSRLVRFLLEHRGDDGCVTLPRSMVELAQSLNIGRSSLYRSIDTLVANGCIRRDGKRLWIDDIQRLQAAL